MASEPFEIVIESLAGGLTSGPYTGNPDQYASASMLDYRTEPGALVGMQNLEATVYGPFVNNASYSAVPMAITSLGGSNGQELYGLFPAHSGAMIGSFAIGTGSNGSLVATSIKRMTEDIDLTSESDMEGQFATPFVDYLGSLIYGVSASGGTSDVEQSYPGISNSSIFTRTNVAGATVTDLLVQFGYCYISNLQTSNSSPGFIERYDFSNGSYIDAASARLVPAVELERGWNPVCMDNFGEYIAIASLPTTGIRRDSWSQSDKSRIYIWDGISTTFEAKADVPGAAITAIKVCNGQLFGFASVMGGIDIYRYLGGNSTQRVGHLSIAPGFPKNSTDNSLPFVRPESISVSGNIIYFGVVNPTVSAPRGYLYSFDTVTGAVDMVLKPSVSDNIRGVMSSFVSPFVSVVGFTTTSSPSSSGRYSFVHANVSSGSQQTASFSFTSPTYFAPSGKKMKVEKVHIRHNYFPANKTLSVYLNRNLEAFPRSSTSSLTAQVINLSGADASIPGVGGSSQYEHVYSFQQTDGTPYPLLDSFQLAVQVSNASGIDRPRIFLPITIKGTLIDSPN